MNARAKKLSDLGKRWSDAPGWANAIPRVVTSATLAPQAAPKGDIEKPADLGAEFRHQYEIWRRDHPAEAGDAIEALAPIADTRFDMRRGARIVLIVGGAALATFYIVGVVPNQNGGGLQSAPPPEPQPVKLASAAKAPRLEVPPMPLAKPSEMPAWPSREASAPETEIAHAEPAPISSPEPAPKLVAVMPAEEIERIRTRGEEFIATGDLAAARLLLERAAKAQDARAAFALASTYDPAVLDTLKVYGAKGDIELAIMWYERAKQYGSKDAGQRLIAIAGRM
jgi:TPR repeat protein